MPLPLNVDSNGTAYMAYDSTNDRAYVEGAMDSVITTCTAAQAAAGFTLVNARSAVSYYKRGLIVNNGLNVTATVTIKIAAQGGGQFVNTIQFTLTTGGVATITSAGGSVQAGTLALVAGYAWSALDFPSNNVVTITVTAAGATTGTFGLDLTQQT